MYFNSLVSCSDDVFALIIILKTLKNARMSFSYLSICRNKLQDVRRNFIQYLRFLSLLERSSRRFCHDF